MTYICRRRIANIRACNGLNHISDFCALLSPVIQRRRVTLPVAVHETRDMPSCLCCFSVILCLFRTLLEGEAICFVLYSRNVPVRSDTELSVSIILLCITWTEAVMQVAISSKTIPPLGQTPWTRLKGSKTLPQDNHCVQKASPLDKTGSQKPHPWDIKSKNFTNISINSDTIRNEKLCGLNK